MGDLYELLEVHRRASTEVIDAAFKALMRRHHPDRKQTAGDVARRLNEARDILSDPARRAEYDARSEVAEGTVIGDWRIEEPIGEGGFGRTYRGSHVIVGEPVCIKHCSQISAADTAILIEEAKAMWDLRHYAIPAVRNLHRLDDGSVALVMSYIPGPTLGEVVQAHAKRGERIDPEHVAWMVERVLNALSYMHRHGIVHGDLKPQNLIVQPDSHMVVLVDFGLAAIKPSRSSAAKGYTDLFAPPEQKAGSPLLPQTDFYSLGMTILYALCGGDHSLLDGKKVPSDVPDAFCRFIERLLARDPLDRPDWQKANLLDVYRRVRSTSFGRRRSAMKPLQL